MKNRATLLFLTICLFGLCLSPAYAESDQDTIIYSFPSNVGPLNPHLYSPSQMFAQEMVYDGLVSLSMDGTIIPSLATEWSVSPDGLTYTFKIRDSVKFSDGTELTARVVKQNFEIIMGNAQRHLWLPLTSLIKDFDAPDDSTFILHLKEPYYPTLNDLALPRPFRMLSPRAFSDNGMEAPIGTGPWKLTKVVLGQYDLFERNETYWGNKAKVKNIKIMVLPDPLARTIAMETNEIDIIYGIDQISFDSFSNMQNNPNYSTQISPAAGTFTIATNSSRGATKDKLVRKALQHILNKVDIMDGVLLGAQQEADTLFAPDVPYCNVGLIPYDYNPQKGEELLDRAGWKLEKGAKYRTKDGETLAIQYCFIGNDPVQKAIGEIIQIQFEKCGIYLELIGEEEDSYLRRQKYGEFGMIVSTTWGPPFEPHAMLGSMRYPAHADYMAQSGLTIKAEIDGKITKVLSTTKEDERQELYKEILTTLHDEAIYLPIFYISSLEAHKSSRLSNVSFGPGKTKIPFELFTKLAN